MNKSKLRHNQAITAQQRRKEIIDLLARGVIRMHERQVVHRLSTSKLTLDQSPEMPLSVSERPHELTAGDQDHA